MRAGNKRIFLIVLTLVISTLSACKAKDSFGEGKTYNIYYVNNDETKLLSYEYVTETTDSRMVLEELITCLKSKPEKMGQKAPLEEGISLLEYTMENGVVTMNFDERYRSLSSTKEVLIRAAIVRTLTQMSEIEYVTFTIQGEQLEDSNKVAIGMMSKDTFIENTGNEINAYEKVNLRLYFATDDGTHLREENQRNVVYNSNISMEKLIVEKIIAGPGDENAFPTINPDTKIVGVTVKDGVCYVNLSEEFLTQPYNVSSEVTIYSIVNSLVELSNVNKVQISVNGETNILYKESISLNAIFERKLDLVG